MSYQLINRSAHDTGLPSESVDCITTSPPYFGLRSYSGDQGIDWPEVRYSPMPGLPPLTIPAMRCGLGEESTPEAYIGHLILVMREMWRVLKPTGCAWVNLGDSYNGSGGAGGDYGSGGLKEGQPKYPGRKVGTLKAKDLIQIPARFALAAQADGWWIRSRLPWFKRNGMPESAGDRPTQTIEDVYLLAKSERYFYDAESVKMPVSQSSLKDGRTKRADRGTSGVYSAIDGNCGFDPSGRSYRSSDPFFRTWQGLLSDPDGEPLAFVVNTKGYSAAHFAVFPQELVEPMIKAGSSARGVCPACGAPWVRLVERTGGEIDGGNKSKELAKTGIGTNGTGKSTLSISGPTGGGAWALYGAKSTTTGWEPTCRCDAGEPTPATVLDPFSGSGTSGRAALKLGRSYIGVDVSAEYLTELAPERLSNVQMQMAM